MVSVGLSVRFVIGFWNYCVMGARRLRFYDLAFPLSLVTYYKRFSGGRYAVNLLLKIYYLLNLIVCCGACAVAAERSEAPRG